MTTENTKGWRRYSLWIFVALAYSITWILWLPVQAFAYKRGYILPDPTTLPVLIQGGFQDLTHILISSTFVLISGPMVAAIIVLAFESGRKGLMDLWKRSTYWRVGWRWYLIILGTLCVIFLPTAVIGAIRGTFSEPIRVYSALIWLAPIFVFEVLASGLEEPGWRGYALPNLQSRHSARKSSLILGIIWGIWHWPIYLPVYNSILNKSGGTQAEAVITALIQLAIYIFGAMVAEALIYTWIYNHTRSVFLCILFHTLHNLAAIYIAIIIPSAAQILPLVGSITEWVIAIILMRYFWIESPGMQGKLAAAPGQAANQAG